MNRTKVMGPAEPILPPKTKGKFPRGEPIPLPKTKESAGPEKRLEKGVAF